MQNNRSWLEISERRLQSNFKVLTGSCVAGGESTSVLAVIKAGAYGHGADLCAAVLASAGASWLGVADPSEGAHVRRSLQSAIGHRDNHTRVLEIQPRILVMCGLLPGDAADIVRNELTPVIWSTEQLDWLAPVSTAAAPLNFHLEIDTGMARQGVVPNRALEAFLDHLSRRPELRLEGLLTHFASAELSGSPLMALQQTRFETALEQISDRGLRLDWIHAGNSSFIDEGNSVSWLHQLARLHGTQVFLRSGLALYGYCLPLQNACSTIRGMLRPVLSWKSRIIALSDLEAHSTVGYNSTYIAEKVMRLALIPVGYADGLRRELSGTNSEPGGWVIICGKRALIVGRISMNLTTVDVTSIPEAAVGNEVTLLGDGITAEDHAEIADTIPYEILCGLRAQPLLTR